MFVSVKAVLMGVLSLFKKWSNQAHALARQLRGIYTSMEEVECRDLLNWARNLDQVRERERCLILIDGAGKCWTSLNNELKSIRKGFKGGRVPRSQKYPEIVDALARVVEDPNNPGLLLQALRICYNGG